MRAGSPTEIPVLRVPSSAFEGPIRQVRSMVDGWRACGLPIRRFQVETGSLLTGLPIAVGAGAQSKVILRKSTAVELGNPATASCAFPLWSADPGLLRDGLITLVGPDLADSEDKSLPFAQILMVAGRTLSYAAHSQLERLQYVGDQVEGYMIRSAPGRIWSRISHEVMTKGFGFELLGRALMGLYKRALPGIEAIELLFVTVGRAEVEQLAAMGDQVRALGHEFVRREWLERGIDLDTCMEHDCTRCHEKPDCDDIRDLVQIAQKAKRERKRRSADLADAEPTGGVRS